MTTASSSDVQNPAAGPTASAVNARGVWNTERAPEAGVVFIQRGREDGKLGGAEPADWRQRLTAAMRRLDVTVVGAKRLTEDGGGEADKIAAMGEFVIHPKGFHHVGKGLPATAYRFPEEVDAIAAGVLAVDLHAFDAVGGETILNAEAGNELGAVTLCLAVRELAGGGEETVRGGGRCVCVPSVVVVDGAGISPSEREAKAFEKRFGFDWLAADLDAVIAKYDGGPMLWNVRYFGTAMPFEKYAQRPAVHWQNYEKVEVYRQRADHLAKLVVDQCPRDGQVGEKVLDLGCGDGLFTHLVAAQGLAATGLDLEAEAIGQAEAETGKRSYPGESPTFVHGEPGPLPFEDETFGLVFMWDVIEHLPNPVSVLGEVMRVLGPDGKLLLSTPAWQFGGSSDPTYHVTEYTAEELTRQVNAVGRAHGVRVLNLGKIGGVYRDLVLIAGRVG